MMKKFLYISLIAIMFCVVRPAAATVSLVVIGDSLSAGYGISQADTWVERIAQRWQRDFPDYSIINASISGDTTQGGLNRLADVVERHQPDVVFIELGGNDGLRGFSLTTMRNNLSQMIDYLQDNDIYVAISQIDLPPNLGQRYATEFSRVFPELAEQYDIPLIPFFMLDIAIDPALMQNDGIHPNLAAQDVIAEIMEPQLRALLDKIADKIAHEATGE